MNQNAIVGAWGQHAACIGATHLMEMPASKTTGQRVQAATARHRIDAARTICRNCPVLHDCRQWALTSPDPCDGMIAGALTPDERTQRRHARGTPRDQPIHIPASQAARSCNTCGYNLAGSHHRRLYCSDACNPTVTGTSRQRWDQHELAG